MAAETNWYLLSDAIRWWTGHKPSQPFTYREVPWIVPVEYNMVTCPDERYLVNSQIGSHVGSAEQSFIYLDHTGQLPKGRWIACTPCFRREDVVDETHQLGFMKVELYQTSETCERSLDMLVRDALAFFRSLLVQQGLHHMLAYVAPTQDGFDIMIDEVEVGSYGIREYDGLRWIYGTAIAEPRFSTARRMARESRVPI